MINSDRQFIFDESCLKGVDQHGNEYYEWTHPRTKQPRREVKLKRIQTVNGFGDFSLLPLEWQSWLNFRRLEAPRPQDSQQLEISRAYRIKKSIEWEEQERMQELRSLDGLHHHSFRPSSSGTTDQEQIPQRPQRSDTTNLRQQRISSSEDRGTANMWQNVMESARQKEQGHEASLNRMEDLDIETARRINEEFKVQQSTQEGYIPPHADQINLDEKLTPNYFPSASLARDSSMRMVDDTSEPKNSDHIKSQERSFSMNRTSVFLGKHPEIRPEALRKLRQLERQLELENEQGSKQE